MKLQDLVTRPAASAPPMLAPIPLAAAQPPGSRWQQALAKLDHFALQVPGVAYLVEDVVHQPKYKEVWQPYRPAAKPTPPLTSVDALRNRLGLEADWRSAPRLKALLDVVVQQRLATPDTLANLARIVQQHGKVDAELVSQKLLEYWQSFPSPGAEQKGILQNALFDLANPARINQGDKPTCTATAVQKKLALARPVEYVAILTTLARNQDYLLPSGTTLAPNNFWRCDPQDTRSYSCRILENAFMDLGRKVVNVERPFNSVSASKGLYGWQTAQIVRAVFGDNHYHNHAMALGQELVRQMEDELARGRSVVVSFSTHTVLAVGMDKTQVPHRVILDSWDEQYSMTVDDFVTRVREICAFDDPGRDHRSVPTGSKVLLDQPAS